MESFRYRPLKILEQVAVCVLVFSVFAFCLEQQTASTVEPPRTVDRSFDPEIKNPAFPLGKDNAQLLLNVMHWLSSRL